MQRQLGSGAILLGLCMTVFAQAAQSRSQGAQGTSQAARSASQAQQSTETTTFTSRTEVVLVPVAVREKSGEVASGLKKDDFKLAVDGKSVSIASFEEVKSGAGPALPPIERGVYTNRIVNEDQPQRLTVLLLDHLNTPFLNQEEERQEVAKFLQRELKPDESVALLALTRGGLRLLQTFTTSSGDLTVALRRTRMSRSEMHGLHWVGPLPQDASGEFLLRDRIRLTLDELEQLGNALAGVPGRKVVVWMTGGFPYLPRERHSAVPYSTEFLGDYERLWRELNQANVSLYPIDAKGLVNTLFERRFSAEHGGRAFHTGAPRRPRYDTFQEEQDTLKNFAAETGGVACVNRNQYASCIDAAQREAVDYYLLSFKLAPEMREKSWHRIQVKMDGKYEVHARQGFTVEKPKTPDLKDEIRLMAKALRSPLEYTGVKMSFRWLDVKPIPAGNVNDPARKKSPAAKYPPVAIAKFRLQLAPRSVDAADQNRLELTLMAVAIDTTDTYVCELAKSIDAHLNEAELRESDTGGTEVDNEVALPAGHLRVRFAVRDRMTGRIGTVEAPIDVAGQ